MTDRFDYFAVIAGMRTGSNLLEEQINAYGSLTCHGELFNPHFVGRPKHSSAFGFDMERRDADPEGLVAAMRAATEGLGGFRIFDDHDRNALQICLDDPRCAKIVLSRAPLDSYVSLKIARKTGQWWLSDITSAKPGKAHFDAGEFEHFLTDLGAFHHLVRRSLQVTGQTAFFLRYEDLGDAEIIAGLARFLGAEGGSGARKRHGRVQNPTPLAEKVENFEEMTRALTARDPFDLDGHPSFEPPRGPNVKAYIIAVGAPVVYLPIEGTDIGGIKGWLSGLGGADGGTETGLSQRDLRRWKREHTAHRSFTMVQHPVARAYAVFCRSILPSTGTGFEDVRDVLVKRYKLPLPDGGGAQELGAGAVRDAFLAFLVFLKSNLGQQTSLPVAPAWATQSALLTGMAGVIVPDIVLRAEALDRDLAALAEAVGASSPELPRDTVEPGPIPLDAIYDAEIEAAARAAYRRDYIAFGYGDYAANR